jgi:hypothetical protein
MRGFAKGRDVMAHDAKIARRKKRVSFKFDNQSVTDVETKDTEVISVDDETVIVLPKTETKNAAAQALRAIPSEKRTQASRENGKKGGRKRRCHECKDEIKPGDSWERHSYGKGRYLYCGNCAERIRQEQRETDRYEGRYYP